MNAVEFLKYIFLYKENEPLLFTQLYFWIFYAIVLTVYSFIHPRTSLRNGFLFLVSLFFYYKTSGFFVTILLFSTITDFFIGKAIYASPNKLARKWWLAFSMILNLGVLVFFKYAYFFTESFNSILNTHFQPINYFAHWSNSFFGSEFEAEKILLPVGISFFTFQTMSYTIDIYRDKLKPVSSLVDFGFYVTFFPQLVAGPIVRASEFIPQLYQQYQLTRFQFGLALFWILNGLLKKTLLSDYIAVNFIDRIFANPGSYTGFENLMALYGYSLQVYADFSGYTDIAIGVALLLGFTLPVNFNSPYKATNAGDFWKRWHISLSTWLKDYLYIPMGGNRGGSYFTYIMLGILLLFAWMLAASWTFVFASLAFIGMLASIAYFVGTFRSWLITNVNLMMTMLIGGLWHGPSWNFVIWGGLNGLGIVIYKLWRKISPWENKNTWYKRVWAIFLTFTFISITRIWFRTGSNNTWEEMNEIHNVWDELFAANVMLKKILFGIDWSIAPQVIAGFWNVFLVMLLGFIIHWLPSITKEKYRHWFATRSYILQGGITLAVVIIVYQVLSAGMNPFIYFQF